jgi:hypothetical protein
MQHFLKPVSRSAGTEIVAAELFEQLDFAAMNGAITTFYASFAQGTPDVASTWFQKECWYSWGILRDIRASD